MVRDSKTLESGYEQRLMVLAPYSLEKRRQKDVLMQTLKTIKDPAKVRDHRAALFQIKESDTFRGSGKTMVGKHVTAGLKGKSLVT